MRRDFVGRKPDELLGVRNEIEAAMGRRAGPHLLTDATAARGYRLLEAANFLLVAARAAERGQLNTVRVRLEGVAKSVETTLKEIGP